MNRFKWFDLVVRVPEGTTDGGSKQCTRGSDQNHPKEKEMQEAKWLPEEALQIAEERREAKGQGEKERYTLSNEK